MNLKIYRLNERKGIMHNHHKLTECHENKIHFARSKNREAKTQVNY